MIFENEQDTKTKFADAWLRNPNDPFQAALRVLKNDISKALWVAQHWISDAFVWSEKERLIKEFGPREFLPTQEDLARKLWDDGNGIVNPDVRIRYLELFSRVLGYVEKPSDKQVQVNIDNRRVMIVKDHGSDEDWERQAKLQQVKLIEHGGFSNNLATDTGEFAGNSD